MFRLDYITTLLKIFGVTVSVGSILGIVLLLASVFIEITKPTVRCETGKGISEREAVDIGKYYVTHDADLLKEIGLSSPESLLKILDNETVCCGASFNVDDRSEHRDLWYFGLSTKKLELNFEVILLIDRCGNIVNKMSMMTPRGE